MSRHKAFLYSLLIPIKMPYCVGCRKKGSGGDARRKLTGEVMNPGDDLIPLSHLNFLNVFLQEAFLPDLQVELFPLLWAASE